MTDILKELDIKLKTNGNFDEYKSEKQGDLLLELLYYKIKNYNHEESYDYLSQIFKIIPFCFFNISNQKLPNIISKVNSIHYSIKEQIELEKKQNIEVSSFLKDTVDNIEALTLALNYDYITEYHGNKYSLMEFLVFKLKNPVMIADAIKRFPYVVNLIDSNMKSIFSRIVESYIEAILDFSHVKNKSNDEVVYFDNILALFLTSKELYIDYEYEKEMIKNIECIIDNIDFTNDDINQEKLIFWLNSLKDTLEKKEPSNNFQLDDLLYKYDIPDTFSIVITKEVERISRRLPELLNKMEKNNNDEFIVTIDGDSAYEIDDGLSVRKSSNGNYILGVHIANPTALIKENNIIFEEAKKRTTSIYLSDRTIAMYPSYISKDLMSLQENQYNMALSFYIEINPSTSEVENIDIKEQKIFVNRNLTYDQVNDYLNGTKVTDYLLSSSIEELAIISEILNKKLNIEDFYRKLYRSASNKNNVLTKSQKIVELSMLITNYQIAKYMDFKGYPFIYRNHKVNEEQKLEIERLRELFQDEQDFANFEKHFKVLTSTYPRAQLNTTNEGHFGLGISHYSHVTSPLRREEDNLNHLAIREFIFNNPTDKRAYELETLLSKAANYTNKRRKPIEDFSINYELGKHLEKTKNKSKN